MRVLSLKFPSPAAQRFKSAAGGHFSTCRESTSAAAHAPVPLPFTAGPGRLRFLCRRNLQEDLDGRKPHCLVRWAAAAERVLPCNFPEMEEEEEDENDEAAAVQTEAAAAADGSGSASEPEPARPKQLSDEDTLALLNSGGGGRQDREADPLHAFYVMDYSKVASELAGEKSSYQLGWGRLSVPAYGSASSCIICPIE